MIMECPSWTPKSLPWCWQVPQPLESVYSGKFIQGSLFLGKIPDLRLLVVVQNPDLLSDSPSESLCESTRMLLLWAECGKLRSGIPWFRLPYFRL